MGFFRVSSCLFVAKNCLGFGFDSFRLAMPLARQASPWRKSVTRTIDPILLATKRREKSQKRIPILTEREEGSSGIFCVPFRLFVAQTCLRPNSDSFQPRRCTRNQKKPRLSGTGLTGGYYLAQYFFVSLCAFSWPSALAESNPILLSTKRHEKSQKRAPALRRWPEVGTHTAQYFFVSLCAFLWPKPALYQTPLA
jgi:hypothetical protein